MASRVKEKGLSGRVRKEAVFVMFTVLLILSLWLFVSETVMSQTDGNIIVDEEAYLELEEDYVAQVRSYLEKQGYRNSGVSLTRVVDESGNRSYEMVLHHKKIYKLSEEEQKCMLMEIAQMSFHVSGCEFQVKLLSS